MFYAWAESKREENLAKHGIDFVRAAEVHEHPDRLTMESPRRDEHRWMDLAPAGPDQILLSLVYALRGETVRVISLRKASCKERRLYEQSGAS